MGDSPEKSASPRPMTLVLAAAVAVLAVAVPLIPEPYRAFNVAAFGAVGLFVAARVGFWPGVGFAVGAKLLSDVLNFAAHDFRTDYLPMWEIALSFVVYAGCGRLLRRTENPLAVGGAAVLGSGLFFLTTNFGSWVRQANNRPHTFDGLLLAYQDGLEYYRGTFLGDLGCTAAVFAAHAVLSRAYFPAERVAAATATVPERS